MSLRQGPHTAVAAGLAYWLAELAGFPGGYWAAISAIVVMQSEVGATLIASRDRLAGTAMGAAIGWLTALAWHGSIWLFGAAVLAVMVLSSALKVKNAGRLGGVTVAIIVLIPHSGPAWHIAVERFLEVSFGIVVSLLVAVTWTRLDNLRPSERT